MPPFGRPVDPGCTGLRQMGEGSGSQGTSKNRGKIVGEGSRERQLCSTAVRGLRAQLPDRRKHRG
ncbi:hypothetical protein C0036_24150 [Streptomyces sp. DJ]|nr:hypothetical protein C0036_24150 [Streptomyces sp. DJ]